MATLLALLLTAGYLLGREVIELAWEQDSLDWVEAQPDGFRVVGIRPGADNLAQAVQQLGGANYYLKRTGDGYNIELESFRNPESSERLLTIRVQPDSSPDQQLRLMLQARASGLYTEEALKAERVNFTVLTDPALTGLPVRKIEVLPNVPIAHDKVLAAHGKPDLAAPVENHADGAEQAWIYPRQGAVIFFREKEAVRFRYFDPKLFSGLKGEADGVNL